MSRTITEVEIKCPVCNSKNYKLIKFKGNTLIYQCSCDKKFKAEFESVCIACDIFEEE